MRPVIVPTIAVLGLALAGCVAPDGATTPEVAQIDLGDITTDAQGRCFGRSAGPTETTIVTELIEVVPEVRDENNVLVREAVFRNVTRPRTVRAGEGAQFETVCPQVYTTDFVATLQRALIVRQAYGGQVNGLYDSATSDAVAAFQRARGIDSPFLSAAIARELGLVAQERSAN